MICLMLLFITIHIIEAALVWVTMSKALSERQDCRQWSGSQPYSFIQCITIFLFFGMLKYIKIYNDDTLSFIFVLFIMHFYGDLFNGMKML